MEYLIVKWLHILSSTLLFGTGLGSAFYMFFASRSGDPRVIATVTKYVVIADWLFTAPTVIIQPLTGFYLLHLLAMPFTTTWVLWSLALYLVAGAAWLPVVWMQIQMRSIASDAERRGMPMPDRYRVYLRYWVALGLIAFAALIGVFYLMVAKPM